MAQSFLGFLLFLHPQGRNALFFFLLLTHGLLTLLFSYLLALSLLALSLLALGLLAQCLLAHGLRTDSLLAPCLGFRCLALFVLARAAGKVFTFLGKAFQHLQPAAGKARTRRRRILAHEIAQGRNVVLVLDAVPNDLVALVEVVVRQQRYVGFRALAAAGLIIDVGGDAAEHDPDFEPRLLKPLQQGRREWAVAALAVLGDLIWRGCIGHHHALGLVDTGESAGRSGGS